MCFLFYRFGVGGQEPLLIVIMYCAFCSLCLLFVDIPVKTIAEYVSWLMVENINAF